MVFDASARTSSGHSLNELLLVGPTIQPDLFTILLAFRSHPVALKADIIKMYRQVRMDSRDMSYQTILWLGEQGHPQEFFLSTVTYGVSAAPFLAIRCLSQLAHESGDEFPLAADAVRQSFYVDDVLTGADSAAEAIELVKQLQGLLSRGQFYLSKWSANVSSLRTAIDVFESSEPIALCEDTTALGVLWYPERDSLAIRVPPFPADGPPTKASVLSFVASMFDPLGLLSPATLRGKLLMQDLWRSDAAWHTPAPPELVVRFHQYCNEVQALANISVQRWTGQFSREEVQYVGFADASERACAACIFIRVPSRVGRKWRLLCTKTQVAPVKSVSLPRLELIACLLLSRLMRAALEAHRRESSCAVLYSDSAIALAWIAKPAATWRCFVANRVAKIQSLFPARQWHHIPGSSNPADLATRGLSATELEHSELWWHGPPDFTPDVSCSSIPSMPPPEGALCEQRPVLVAAIPMKSDVHPWFTITNDFRRLLRIMAYVVRAFDRFRQLSESSSRSPPIKKRRRQPDAPLAVSRAAGAQSSRRHDSNLSIQDSVCSRRASVSPPLPQDFVRARAVLTRLAQKDVFADLIGLLSKDSESKLPKTRAWLVALAPFADDSGIVRVGGRLRHADLPYSARHQSLLPTRHPWFAMWVKHLHVEYFHAGPSLILNVIRRSHWPVPDASRVARKVVSSCVKCRRFNPALYQKMGDLPEPRVRPAPPFSHTGVDYAGPFLLHRPRGRSSRV